MGRNAALLAAASIIWGLAHGAGNRALDASVRALAMSGTDLYVGGLFTDAAGITDAD